jgi:hypothetical protein
VQAFDWTNLGFAGAFVVGALAGAVVTIRLARVVAEMLRDIRRAERKDEPP